MQLEENSNLVKLSLQIYFGEEYQMIYIYIYIYMCVCVCVCVWCLQ